MMDDALMTAALKGTQNHHPYNLLAHVKRKHNRHIINHLIFHHLNRFACIPPYIGSIYKKKKIDVKLMLSEEIFLKNFVSMYFVLISTQV